MICHNQTCMSIVNCSVTVSTSYLHVLQIATATPLSFQLVNRLMTALTVKESDVCISVVQCDTTVQLQDTHILAVCCPLRCQFLQTKTRTHTELPMISPAVTAHRGPQ